MKETLIGLNQLIKNEADEILFEKGLLSILNDYGQVHITGSYALDLMTWRDLDIYLEADTISETEFFALGGSICSIFKPVKMNFRNEFIAKTINLPEGLYWGIYLGDERAGAWKIDVWAVKPAVCKQLIKYCTTIKQKLTPETILQILKIKSHCWQDPEYRRSYSSSEIYDAVLENNVTGIKEFRKYLKIPPVNAAR